MRRTYFRNEKSITMFLLSQSVERMIKIKLNNKPETILNAHRFAVGVVSHNKILSVNEFEFA